MKKKDIFRKLDHLRLMIKYHIHSLKSDNIGIFMSMSGTEKKKSENWTKFDRFLWSLLDLGGSCTETVEELRKYADVTDMLLKDLVFQLKHPVLHHIKTILKSSIIILSILTIISLLRVS